MKRVLALALCLMLCAGMLIGCAGDGTDANHVHTFDYTKWSYDANGHWFNATCDCEVVTEEKLKHVDENKDGACDACKYVYECKDGHTYSEEWSVDCTNHFKLANCGHVTAPYAVAAHADGDGDGVCDTCAYVIEDLHEHYYDTAWSGDSEYHWHAALCEHGVEIADKAAHELTAAGYCTVCDAKVKEIDKTDIGAILAAAVAQNDKVVDGNVTAAQLVYGASGSELVLETAQTNEVYYVLGKTDSYIFYKTYNKYGEFVGGDHQWYEGISEDEVFAVQMVAGSNVLEVTAGDVQFLNGYTYQPGGILPGIDVDTTTLANTLYAIYGIAEAGVNVEAFEESYDEATGAYKVQFRYLLVNETKMSDDTIEYQAYLYGVAIEFTVDELGVINRADFAVSSYRNWEMDNDLTYNPQDGSYTLHDNASPSIYAYSVSQRSGERTYTTIYPRASLIPTDFNLSYVTGTDHKENSGQMYITSEEPIVDTNEDGILDLTLTKGEYVRLHLSSLIPSSALASALNINDFSMTYVNNNENESGILWKDQTFLAPSYSSYMDCIVFSVADLGEYTVTINFGDISKTLIVTVPGEAPLVVPENTATQYYVVTTDTYAWEDEYTFTASAEGAYTLTVPAGLGLWIDGATEPAVDYNISPNGGTASFELEAGASIKFTVGAATKNVVWEIGVAFVACEVEGGSGDGGDTPGGETGGSIAADISGVYYTTDGVLTINADGTMTYVAGGRTQNYTYVIEGNNVTYTLNGNDPYDKTNNMAPYFGYLEFGSDGKPVTFVYNGNLALSTTAPGGDGGDTPGGDGGDTPGGDTPGGDQGNGTGTEDDPFVLDGAGDYTCEFPGGVDLVWYTIEVPSTGIITVSSTFASPWIQIGKDVYSASSNSNITPMGETLPSVSVLVSAGTYVIGVGDWNEAEVDVPFTVAFEAKTSDSIEALVGTWSANSSTLWAPSIAYTLTIDASGTGTLVINSGYGDENYTIDLIFVEGENVTIKYSGMMGAGTLALTYAGGVFSGIGAFDEEITFTEGSGDIGGGDVETPAYDTTIVVGENSLWFSADEIAADSATRPLVITEDGNYKFAAGSLFISAITLNGGDAVTKNEDYSYDLVAGEYTVSFSMLSMFGVQADTKQVLNVTKTAAGGEGDEGDELVAKQPIYEEEKATINVSADDLAAGKFYLSFTPYFDGEYYFESGDLYPAAVLDANGNPVQKNDYDFYVLVAGANYFVEVSTAYISSEGDYDIIASYNYPVGHEKNPYWYYISDDGNGNYVGESTVANYKGDYMPVWYKFHAGATGTLTVTSTNPDVLVLAGAFPSYAFDGTGSVSMPVVSGRLYYIGVGDVFSSNPSEITFSATITPGEAVSDGTINMPHSIVIGSNLASVVDGSAVYYIYEFEASGTLILNTASTNVSWYMTADVNTYVPSVSDATISLHGYYGDVIYLVVSTANWQSDDIAFTASVEADPTEQYYENQVITDGTAANEIVIEENSYVTLNFYGMGDFVITWDNADAIVELLVWNEDPTALTSGSTVTAGMFGTNLSIRLPEYAAGTVNLTIAPATAGGDEGGEDPVGPTGSFDDPFALEENNVCAFPGGMDYVFYKYTATEAGTLTVTLLGSDFFWGFGFEVNSIENVATVPTADIALAAGQSVWIGISTYSGNAADVEFTSSFAASEGGEGGGDIPAGPTGSIDDPFALEENNVCAFPGGMDYVFYKYTATEDGILTVTMVSSDYYWAYSFDTSSVNTVGGSTASKDFELTAGQSVYIGISTNSTNAKDVEFTASFVAGGEIVVPETPMVLGNNAISAANVIYAYTADADINVTLSVGGFVVGDITITYSVNGGDAVAMAANTSFDIVLAAGDKLVVTAVTESGYATLSLTETVEEEEVDLEGSGTQTDPWVIVTLPYEVTFSAAHDKYFTYTATEAINLVVTAPAGCYVTNDKSVTGVSGVYTFTLAAGETVSLNTWIMSGSETYTYTFASSPIESGDGGEGGDGGEVGAEVTYLSEKHGSGRYLKVIINAEAGTMTLVRSDATGNFGTGGVQQAEYTYEYDGSTVTVNNVSGQVCTCVFGADGAPTSITWGAAQFINFAVA